MRARLAFTKHGKVRFTSHRDVARLWERSLRKAGVPVAYSQGFSPRPRLHFGLALSTGYESDAEYLDVDLAPTMAPAELASLPARLTPALPQGMAASAVGELPARAPSLQAAVTSCAWSIELRGVVPEQAEAAVDAALAAPSMVLHRTRKGREVEDDIRPQVVALQVIAPTAQGVELAAELGTRPRALRPSELVAALGGDRWEEARVVRTHQWIEHDGIRREPLPTAIASAEERSGDPGPISAAHATRRAS